MLARDRWRAHQTDVRLTASPTAVFDSEQYQAKGMTSRWPPAEQCICAHGARSGKEVYEPSPASEGKPAVPHTVKGVIARSVKAEVELVDVVVPDPGPHDVVVRVQACGVCHTDLHYREGGINDEFPFLLGHEAAGVVETVGEAVTHVAPGDFVVLNWRAVCGECRACKRGRPWYCFNTHNASKRMTLADGTELSPALGIGAFVEKTLVHEGQCTKVAADADPAVAGLLGCGVMAGLGAAMNTGNRSEEAHV